MALTAAFCTATEFVLRGYIYPALFLLAAVTLIYATFKFTMAYIRNKLKTSNLLFISGLSFYIVIILHNVSEAIYFGLYCYFGDKYIIFDLITQFLYPIQGVILITFLFLKLIHIFEQTEFALPKLTIYTFSGLSLIGIVLALMAQTLICFPNFGQFTLGLIAFFASSFIYVFLIIWINLLFLHKLYSVYKSSKDIINCDKRLIRVMTKTAVLCFVSTTFIIVFLIFYFISRVSYSPYLYLISRVALIGDIYTSFGSVFLSYDYFDGLYFKTFGCCHNICKLCWMNCADKDNELTMARMATTSSTRRETQETNEDIV